MSVSSVAVATHRALLGRLGSDPALWSRERRVATLGDIESLRGWLDAREAALLAASHSQRDDVNTGARGLADHCQRTANVSYGEAKRRERRALWLPSLLLASEALGSGQLGSAQADEMCALAERLPPELLDQLQAAEANLVAELSKLTPVQARKRLLAFEAEITPDDGKTKLERQEEANRLRLTKNSDGSTAITGLLDPVSAGYLRTAIDHKVTELWRSQGSGREGVDPPPLTMSNERLRAQALIELVRQGHAAGAGSRGHAELLVLIDYKTLMGDLTASGICRLGDSTPIPGAVARRLACEAGIIPVVLGTKSQPLDVGRASRVATPSQKAAARAVHDTCCIKNCDIAFEHCQMHHVQWWRHGGRSDLDNLVPVCSRHHRLIHDNAWHLHLDTDRVGTLHEPQHLRSTNQPPVVSLQPKRDPQVPDGQPPQPATRPRPQDAQVPMRC